jgi:hypothetical protein
MDGRVQRYVRVYVSSSDRSEELRLSGDLGRLAARVQLFPAELLIKSLGRKIVAEQRSQGLPVEAVHIEVWRIDYAREELEPRGRNLRRFTYDADVEALD